jgi:putative hydrolase of the HAD superfamily
MLVNKVLVFDLDDTLYKELDFVQSGFRAVASSLQNSANLPKQKSLQFMNNQLDEFGRGQIFDSLIREFSIVQASVRELVAIYRYHSPAISLRPEALKMLSKLPQILEKKPYLVTDGNPRVQRSKIKALQISHFFEKTYCTRDFGLGAEKPSLKVFQHILDREKTSMANLTYVGDDPSKDFHSIVTAGGTAIRVRTGRFAKVERKNLIQPQFEIDSMDELFEILVK